MSPCPVRFRSAVLLVNRATSRGVSGATFLALVYLRTPWMTAFVAGALLNALLGKCMKYTLNVRRPVGAALKTPGMPSSHATSLFYFATALSLAAAAAAASAPGVGKVRVVVHVPWLTVPVVTFGYSLIVAYARICLTKVHTFPQVAVGAVLGSVFAFFWTTHVLAACSADERLTMENIKIALCTLGGGGLEWGASRPSAEL
jgi:dolichyldiphosphatase